MRKRNVTPNRGQIVILGELLAAMPGRRWDLRSKVGLNAAAMFSYEKRLKDAGLATSTVVTSKNPQVNTTTFWEPTERGEYALTVYHLLKRYFNL